MGLRRSARVGGGRDVVSLTPTQTVPPAPIPVPPRGMGPGTSVGRALGAAGPYWEDWGGGKEGGTSVAVPPSGAPSWVGNAAVRGGSGGPPVPEDTVGASCPPAAAGGRHVATGTFLLPHGCRLSLLFVPPPHPSQDPHAYSPPPGASPEQLLRIPPLAHIWATSGWGAAAPCPGAFGGQDAAGGGCGVPKAPGARGMNEVVAWATAPEPGGLPRAAGSCAGGMGGAWGAGPPPAVPTLNAPVPPADPGARWQGRWPPRCLHRVGTGMGRGWWPSPCGGWDLRGWCVPPPHGWAWGPAGVVASIVLGW